MAQNNANLIWKIADLLRGPYQPNQYGDVIRGRRSLEPAEPQPLLNADQAAPGPTDDGQWEDHHHLRDARQTMARLPRRHVGGMRQAHRQHEPPAVAGLGVTGRTPCGLAIRIGSTRRRRA
jgi:hypothetical protein